MHPSRVAALAMGCIATAATLSASAVSTPTVQIISVATYTAFFSEFFEPHVSVTGFAGPATGNVQLVINTPDVSVSCLAFLDASGNGSCRIASGFFTYGGSSIATAQYMGDTNYTGTTSSAFPFFAPMPSKLIGLATPEPSLPGQVAHLTMRVDTQNASQSGQYAATGTMDWFVDGGQPCTGTPVVDSVASCDVVFSTAGSHTYGVNYSGDAHFTFAGGNMVTHMVSNAPATITLVSAVNPSALAQPAILRASLSGSLGQPTGTAVFKSGGIPIHGCESVSIYNGAAACSTGTLNPGDHLIAFEYGGDANYPAGTASLTQTVTSTPAVPTVAKRRDFNGDGTSDILWRGSDGSLSVWLMDGVNVLGRSPVFPAVAGDVRYFSGDFDGDGKADVVRQTADGTTTMRLMNGVDIVTSQVIPAAGTLVGVGDFDGDHKTDLLWRTASGQLAVSLMNGTSQTAIAYITFIPEPCPSCSPPPPPPAIAPIGGLPSVMVADFNGDGRDDILDLNTGTSWISMLLMDGTTVTSTTGVMDAYNTGWYPVRVGDFNGDGNADIVWAQSTGATSLWLMNGATILQRGPLLATGSTWSVAAVGDFNGDGKSDLMFRNTTDGSVGRWFMDGLTAIQRNTLLPAGTGWSDASALDVNGDSTTDMVWRADDGSVGLWIMSNPALPYVPTRRTLLGPNTMWTPLP